MKNALLNCQSDAEKKRRTPIYTQLQIFSEEPCEYAPSSSQRYYKHYPEHMSKLDSGALECYLASTSWPQRLPWCGSHYTSIYVYSAILYLNRIAASICSLIHYFRTSARLIHGFRLSCRLSEALTYAGAPRQARCQRAVAWEALTLTLAWGGGLVYTRLWSYVGAPCVI